MDPHYNEHVHNRQVHHSEHVCISTIRDVWLIDLNFPIKSPGGGTGRGSAAYGWKISVVGRAQRGRQVYKTVSSSC